MKKVKVTQEQADWLGKYELSQEQIDHYINIHPFKKRPDSPIVDWSVSKLARALYIGYVVKPDYEIGDWIVRIEDGKVLKITDIDYKVNRNGAIYTDAYDGWLFKSEIRHATDEEVIFSENYREPWELKRHDVLRAKDGEYLVTVREVLSKDQVMLNGGVVPIAISRLEESYQIVCFAEDRKDIE